MSLTEHTISPWTPCEVDAVLKLYALGRPTGGPTMLSEVGWDAHRARCRVRTDRAEWFLKKHHPSVHRLEQHRVVREFIAAGGLAPEIAAMPSGETWLDIGDAYVEVHRIVVGDVPHRPTEHEAVEATRQVALLHGVPVDTIPVEWTGWYRVTDARRLILEMIDHARSAGMVSSELKAILDAELTFDSETVADDCVPVHGDLWRGNWVTDRGHIAALTDFDWLHRGSPMEDLADVILAFASNRDIPLGEPPLVQPPDAVDAVRMIRILNEYERIRGPLESETLRYLPDMLRSMWIRHAVWIVRGADSPLHLQIVLTRTAELCNWIHEALPTILRR